MSTFVMLQNRVMDATLRGGGLPGGNRDQIKEDINEAIKEVDALLRPSTKLSTENLVANQGDYSISGDFGISDITSIRDITYASPTNPDQTIPLTPASPEWIREQRRSFIYSTYVNLWALEGLDTLMLYPATQQTGDTITIYYVPRPADLINNTDVPTGLPPEFHDVYEIAAIKRSMRQSSPEYAMMYFQQFQTRLNDYRKWRNHRDGALPRRIVMGRRNRRMLTHNNSTDLGY